MGDRRGLRQPGGHLAAGDGQMAELCPAAVRVRACVRRQVLALAQGAQSCLPPPRSRSPLGFPAVATPAPAFPTEPAGPSNVPRLRDLERPSWDSLRARPQGTEARSRFQARMPPTGAAVRPAVPGRPEPGVAPSAGTRLWANQPLATPKCTVGSAVSPGSVISQTPSNWSNLGLGTLRVSALLRSPPGLRRCRTAGAGAGEPSASQGSEGPSGDGPAWESHPGRGPSHVSGSGGKRPTPGDGQGTGGCAGKRGCQLAAVWSSAPDLGGHGAQGREWGAGLSCSESGPFRRAGSSETQPSCRSASTCRARPAPSGGRQGPRSRAPCPPTAPSGELSRLQCPRVSRSSPGCAAGSIINNSMKSTQTSMDERRGFGELSQRCAVSPAPARPAFPAAHPHLREGVG